MIYHPDTSDFPGGEEQFLKDYRPSAGRMFKIGMGAGFDDTLPGLLTSLSEMDQVENQPLLTKGDWETSKFYDPEIKWDDSFTTPKARLLKERRDRERELGFLLDRAGMGATASFYAGALVGTVPDPVNYLPFVGIASKAKSAAVLGKIAKSGRLGRGATTAADAVIGTAVLQSLVFKERDTYQLKYDTRDALTELGLALGLGFGFGAILGKVHPKDPDPEELLRLYREREGSIISLNKDGEPIFTPKKDLPPEPTNTRAQQDWDSVAPTDKVEAVRRKIANDAVGTQDNVPIVRQQGAQQAIAQDRATRIQQPVTQEMVDDFDDLMLEKYGDDWFSTQIDYETAKTMGDNARVAEIEKSVDRKDLQKAKALNEGLRVADRAEYEVSQRQIEKSVRNAIQDDEIADELLETFDVDFRKDDVGMYLSGKNLESNLDSEEVAKRAFIRVGQVIAKRQGAEFDALFTEASALTKKGQEALRQNVFRYVQQAKEAILAALRGDTEPIPNEVWNTPRPAPEPLPAPDDTPISANEARLQQMEAALDERIRTAEANGTLSETDARELAYIDEEIVELDKYHQAVSETIECVIANG
jgi:hypothetical protein